MKIGFVLDDGLDKPDGVQQYILTLGGYYREQGHEVRYLVGETTRTDVDGVYSLPKNVKVRFNGNALSIPLPASSKAIKAVLAKEKFDVLHVQTPYSPLFGAKVVRLSHPDTAVVGTFHILPFDRLTRWGTYALGAWLRRSLRRFDGFASVSAPAAAFAKATFKIDSEVIPNSVQIDTFRPRKPVERPAGTIRMLFLGRLVGRKGCRQLLRALVILKQSGCLPAELRLDICGDGPLRKELEHYITRNGLADTITFHGFVTNSQKVTFMQQADVAVFPSLSGESFGIVLIEAMAAGSGVVLGGDNPGYRSVLAEASEAILDAHHPERLADQLAALLDDPAARADLHRRQQKLVKQFDTPVIAERLLELYRSCKTNRISR